jgi:hypothetical protein
MLGLLGGAARAPDQRELAERAPNKTPRLTPTKQQPNYLHNIVREPALLLCKCAISEFHHRRLVNLNQRQ